MSAEENLNPQQFYHGTSGKYDFKPGDVLTPAEAPRNVMGGQSAHVYYTSRLDTASTYATPHFPSLDSDDYTPGRVYAVQPETRSGRRIGKHAEDPMSGVPGNKQAYRTKGRLRVLNEVDPNTGEPR